MEIREEDDAWGSFTVSRDIEVEEVPATMLSASKGSNCFVRPNEKVTRFHGSCYKPAKVASPSANEELILSYSMNEAPLLYTSECRGKCRNGKSGFFTKINTSELSCQPN